MSRYYDNGQIELQRYYLNDKLHNENGPAHIEYYENGNLNYEKYYIDDVELDLTRFKHINKSKLIELINCTIDIDSLLRLKLVSITMYKQYKTELLELIDSKMIMFTLL